MATTKLKVTNLVRHFGEVKAVDGISFELKAGEVVGFIGANGAGKTTTMRVLTTLDVPDEGTIEIDGVNAQQHPEQVKGKIGWMPDGFTPAPHTTVYDYIDFFARAYGLCGTKRQDEVARVLEFCHITELQDRFINRLSKGQTQRVSLARLLIGNPELLIMDEPAAGLDPQARLEFKQLVRQLKAQGKTMLISSHILSELAEMCDSMLFMDNGKIIHRGSCEELLAQGDKGIPYVIRPLPASAAALLAKLQSNSHWENVVQLPDGSITAICKLKSDEEIAQELRAICQDHDVTEITRHRRNLEETFVNILHAQK